MSVEIKSPEQPFALDDILVLFPSAMGVSKRNTLQHLKELFGQDLSGVVTSFKTRTGAVVPQAGDYTKADVGLSNVDNTADASKPVSTAQQTAIDARIPLTQRGAPSGVATLGADGKIPANQLPAVAIGETFVVASEVAMLALTAQQGDVAIRTDLSNAKFILLGPNPSVVGNWSEIVVSEPMAWGSIVGNIGDQADLDAELNDLANGIQTLGTTKADKASPVFTGTPTAPTAAPGNSTTQLATTAFVAAANASKADLNSPALTGTPTAPTAGPGTNTTQLATTAFVMAANAANAKLAAVNTQTGAAYTLQATDEGNILVFTSAAAVTLTVPTGLRIGFTCEAWQYGTGQITVVAGSGMNVRSADNFMMTAKQFAPVSIRCVDAANALISGNLVL